MGVQQRRCDYVAPRLIADDGARAASAGIGEPSSGPLLKAQDVNSNGIHGDWLGAANCRDLRCERMCALVQRVESDYVEFQVHGVPPARVPLKVDGWRGTRAVDEQGEACSRV